MSPSAVFAYTRWIVILACGGSFAAGCVAAMSRDSSDKLMVTALCSIIGFVTPFFFGMIAAHVWQVPAEQLAPPETQRRLANVQIVATVASVLIAAAPWLADIRT